MKLYQMVQQYRPSVLGPSALGPTVGPPLGPSALLSAPLSALLWAAICPLLGPSAPRTKISSWDSTPKAPKVSPKARTDKSLGVQVGKRAWKFFFDLQCYCFVFFRIKKSRIDPSRRTVQKSAREVPSETILCIFG